MTIRTITQILLGILPCFAFARAPLSQTQHARAAGEKARVVISFHSRGSGINSAAREKLDEFVENYEAETGVKLAQDNVHWGREGEVDYCLR